MDLDASAAVGFAPDLVFAQVRDLATYPRWFRIVDAAVPDADASADAAPDDPPAWVVDLAARVGPLKRTKRVRMVRASCDGAAGTVRFERRERDGRDHSTWVLDASVSAAANGSTVHVHLHYGGLGWLPGLDLLLRDEARRAGGRLERLIASRP